MIRRPCSLLFLALALALMLTSPLYAEDSVPTAIPAVRAAGPDAALNGETCSEPTASPATPIDLIFPPSDFLLCSCTFCRQNPDVECQISPDGFSILCADWVRLRC